MTRSTLTVPPGPACDALQTAASTSGLVSGGSCSAGMPACRPCLLRAGETHARYRAPPAGHRGTALGGAAHFTPRALALTLPSPLQTTGT